MSVLSDLKSLKSAYDESYSVGSYEPLASKLVDIGHVTDFGDLSKGNVEDLDLDRFLFIMKYDIDWYIMIYEDIMTKAWHPENFKKRYGGFGLTITDIDISETNDSRFQTTAVFYHKTKTHHATYISHEHGSRDEFYCVDSWNGRELDTRNAMRRRMYGSADHLIQFLCGEMPDMDRTKLPGGSRLS